MYTKRKLEEKIERYMKVPEIIAIVGPRQSGKTTLLERFYLKNKQKSSFVSFEEPEILTMFEKDTFDFINLYVKGKKILFIDEFQYAKNGGKILKQIYDKYKIKILITGSSSVDLTVKALKYLTGRIFAFELFPFDFEEYLNTKDKEFYDIYKDKIKVKLENLPGFKKLAFGAEIGRRFTKYFEEYLIYGGYPRVVLTDDIEEKKEVLKGIYSTFILREVKDYLGLVDNYKLHNLVKSLALQAGNLIEYREISSITEYSFVSLKKYLNFLESAYICSLVRPFFRNKRKEIVKNPKIYFLDTGLRNYISGDFRGLESRPDGGSLLENGIFSNFRKKGVLLKYWRDKTKNEVDFIVEAGPLKAALEVKMNLSKCKKEVSTIHFLKNHPDFFLFFLYYRGFEQNLKDKHGFLKLPAFMSFE